MTVKEILKSAILFAGKPELLGLNVFSLQSETAPTAAQQSEIDLFVQCFNYVYKEIAGIYFPLLEKEQISFNDGKFLLKNLSKKIISIKKLLKNNKKLKFYQYPGHIDCETDNAIIVYAYLPEDFVLTDEINLFGGKVLPQVMAYGVVCEYCFISGNYSDADIWQARFKSALEAISSKKSGVVLPKRRFI